MIASAIGGCASLKIEVPGHVVLTAGQRAEIVGDISNARTPVGGVDLTDGHLPPGLELEYTPETCSFAITGVPSAEGQYEVGIFAWTYGTNFPGDTATVRLSIDVVD